MYLSNKIPLYDDNDQVSGILGISFDITERKKLEEDLVRAKEAAEAANNAKTEFLENMRHDIRTPLTGIVGFSEIIKKEANQPQVKEYADNLIAASHMLLEFLNDILEAIKVLTGDIPTAKRKFSLVDLTAKVVQLLKPRALEKHLDIEFEYDKTMAKYFIGDPGRLQRILLELLSNALNFTDEGRVSITLKLIKQENRSVIIKCVVQDTGAGIPADKQDDIFLRFKRLMPSYEGIYQGAGLGLTIVKQFIDDLQGEIYCQSQVGTGSIFTCLVPLQVALTDDNADVSEINVTPYISKVVTTNDYAVKTTEMITPGKARILIVEDQPLAAKVAQTIIAGLDCEVDVVTDGRSAVQKAQEQHYDLIFMDVGLPDLSGFEVTKRIRAQEWKLDQHVPILALTAHIDSENKQQCIESGMDAVLSKPLVQTTAKDIIDAFIPSRKAQSLTASGELSGRVTDEAADIVGEPIDIADGMAKINDTYEKAREMIDLLIKGFQEDMPTLIKAKQHDDWETIQGIVHKHRGGSLYCGTPRFQRICALLEDYLSLKKTKLREQLYEQLLDEMDKLREARKKL